MPSRLEQHPGLLLHDITRLFRQCFGQRLRDLGLSEPQWRLLGTVNRLPDTDQTQLAALLGIGKAPLGKLVDRLERDQLLQRHVDPRDRRIKRLRLTSHGQPIATAMRTRHLDFEKVYLGGLSKPQRDELARTLLQMYRNLGPAEADERLLQSTNAQSLIQLISAVTRLNGRHFDLQLKALGFTRSQWLIIAAVEQQEGLSQSALADKINMAKAPLGALVEELEADHWLQRNVDSSDRRARTLYLTQACRDNLQRLASDFDRVHQRSLGEVSKTSQHNLRTALQEIRTRLKACASASPASDQEKHR